MENYVLSLYILFTYNILINNYQSMDHKVLINVRKNLIDQLFQL